MRGGDPLVPNEVFIHSPVEQRRSLAVYQKMIFEHRLLEKNWRTADTQNFCVAKILKYWRSLGKRTNRASSKTCLKVWAKEGPLSLNGFRKHRPNLSNPKPLIAAAEVLAATASTSTTA